MSSFCLVLCVCVLLSLCAVTISQSLPYLVFSVENAIIRMAPDGSSPSVVVSGLTDALHLDHHQGQNKLYWTSPTESRVYELHLSGSNTPIPVITTATNPRGLAVDSDSDKLYFTYVSGVDSHVAVHGIDGPPDDFTDLTNLATDIQYAELAVDPASGYLYIATQSSTQSTILKYPLPSGTPTTLYTTSPSVCISSLALNLRLYWTEGCGSGVSGIRAVNPTSPGPSPPTVFMPAADVKYGLESRTAGSVTTTYWTSENRVYSVTPFPGGSPTTLISVPPNKYCKGLKMIYP